MSGKPGPLCWGLFRQPPPSPFLDFPLFATEPFDLPAWAKRQLLGGAVGLQPMGLLGQRGGIDALRHQHHPRPLDLGKLRQVLQDLLTIGLAIDHELYLIIVLGDQAANHVGGVAMQAVQLRPAQIALGRRRGPQPGPSPGTDRRLIGRGEEFDSFGLIDIRSQATGR